MGYVFGMEKKITLNISQAQAPSQSRKRYSDISLSEKLSTLIAWLQEHKAQEVVSLELGERSGFADAMIVCSAGSMRHAQSLADGISALCHERNLEYLRMEGYEAGQWILVDLNDIIIHIFFEPVRDLYRLEELWKSSPLRKKDTDTNINDI